jgi:hypothetical protein
MPKGGTRVTAYGPSLLSPAAVTPQPLRVGVLVLVDHAPCPFPTADDVPAIFATGDNAGSAFRVGFVVRPPDVRHDYLGFAFVGRAPPSMTWIVSVLSWPYLAALAWVLAASWRTVSRVKRGETCPFQRSDESTRAS